MQSAKTNGSEQGHAAPSPQTEIDQTPAPSTIKVQHVRRGERIEDPNATIIVTGTMAGSVDGRTVKIWRAQQATIKATESIFIAKEVIGSADTFTDGGIAGAAGGFTSLIAPEVIIGIPGQQASLAKELDITTNMLTMHQVSIYNPVTVTLGPAIYHRKKVIEGAPARLKNRIKAIGPQLCADIEDFACRIERPGNAHLKPFLTEFVFAQQKNFVDNKVKIFSLLRKLLNDLYIRTSGDVLQRWRERLDMETELREKLAELDRLYEQLANMSLNLSIIEMKKEASILIHYGDEEYRLKGPLSQTSVAISFTRVDDPTAGLNRGEISIDQQPLG